MSNYKLVTQSYPRTYWEDHGDEILDTANELHSDKWSFKESRELLSNGLRTRGNEATGGDVKQVFAQGAAIWLFTTFAETVSFWSGFELGLIQNAGTSFTLETPDWFFVIGLMALIASLAMAFSTRWPAMLLAAGSVVTVSVVTGGFDTLSAVTIAVAGLVAIFGNGRRVIAPVALLGLLAFGTLTSGFWALALPSSIPILFIGGLMIAKFDARLFAAATVFVATRFAVFTLDVLTDPNAFATDETFAGLPAPAVFVMFLVAVALVIAMAVAIVVKSTRSSAQRL